MTTPAYELAQLNIALMRAPIDAPELAAFAAALDRINQLAEASPGYRWRLQTDDGNATSLRPFGDEYLVNLSVWRDVASLHDYVYRSAHKDIMARRREWFHHMREAWSVLWWVPAGHRPTVAEAKVRLQMVRADGPSADAFTFKRPFTAPGTSTAQTGFDDTCPAT